MTCCAAPIELDDVDLCQACADGLRAERPLALWACDECGARADGTGGSTECRWATGAQRPPDDVISSFTFDAARGVVHQHINIDGMWLDVSHAIEAFNEAAMTAARMAAVRLLAELQDTTNEGD